MRREELDSRALETRSGNAPCLISTSCDRGLPLSWQNAAVTSSFSPACSRINELLVQRSQ
jgi:hypothetical protein